MTVISRLNPKPKYQKDLSLALSLMTQMNWPQTTALQKKIEYHNLTFTLILVIRGNMIYFRIYNAKSTSMESIIKELSKEASWTGLSLKKEKTTNFKVTLLTAKEKEANLPRFTDSHTKEPSSTTNSTASEPLPPTKASTAANSKTASKTAKASSNGTMAQLTRAISKKTKDTERGFSSLNKEVLRVNGRTIKLKVRATWLLAVRESEVHGTRILTKSQTNFSDILIHFCIQLSLPTFCTCNPLLLIRRSFIFKILLQRSHSSQIIVLFKERNQTSNNSIKIKRNERISYTTQKTIVTIRFIIRTDSKHKVHS